MSHCSVVLDPVLPGEALQPGQHRRRKHGQPSEVKLIMDIPKHGF